MREKLPLHNQISCVYYNITSDIQKKNGKEGANLSGELDVIIFAYIIVYKYVSRSRNMFSQQRPAYIY